MIARHDSAPAAFRSLVLVALVFGGCQGFDVIDRTISECTDSYEGGELPPAEITVAGHRVTIDCVILANCCTFDVDLDLEGDTFTISDEEGRNPCDCLCTYDVTYLLEVDEAGDYVLSVEGQSYDFTI